MGIDNYIYIHIGVPKTGTTAIQKFCMLNKKLLAEKGVLYPDVNLRGFGHHDLAFLLNGAYPEWAETQDIHLDTLTLDLEKSTKNHHGSILLSSENFYLYPKPDVLKKALYQSKVVPRFRPKIIIYLRNQLNAHESWYNQTIKAQGYTHTIKECIERFSFLFNYEENLRQWVDVFGQENIIVRLYPEVTNKQFSLIEDFLTIIGITSYKEFDFNNNYINTKLNHDLLEYQRLMNNLPVTIKEKRSFHKQLIELSKLTENSGLFDESPTISASLGKQIMQYYEQSNCHVAKQFFGKSSLFNYADIDGAESADFSGLTIEKLTMINSWLLLKNKEFV